MLTVTYTECSFKNKSVCSVFMNLFPYLGLCPILHVFPADESSLKKFIESKMEGEMQSFAHLLCNKWYVNSDCQRNTFCSFVFGITLHLQFCQPNAHTLQCFLYTCSLMSVYLVCSFHEWHECTHNYIWVYSDAALSPRSQFLEFCSQYYICSGEPAVVT